LGKISPLGRSCSRVLCKPFLTASGSASPALTRSRSF
jgi:hypothetical protein